MKFLQLTLIVRRLCVRDYSRAITPLEVGAS